MFGRLTIVAINFGRPFLFSTKWLSEKNNKLFFLKKKTCSLAFPKRIRSLIKPLLKNSFPTTFQGTGPWEGPIHFSRFVLRVHNCSNFFQSWSWSQEKKGRLVPKEIAKFKVQTFPKRIRPPIKPLLKNNLSTNFQGTGPWGSNSLSLYLFFSLSLILSLSLSLAFALPLPLSLCSSSSSPSPSSSSFAFSFSFSFSRSLSLFLSLSLCLVTCVKKKT